MGARILIVDDSPTIRKVVASILETREYEAITAEDGEDALDRLAESPVDLVLLDFVMPRMNGYQFCRELRARDDLKNLPVVLMSAKGDRIREQFVQQTGAIDAITKPFDARGLIAVVEAALQKRQAGRGPKVPDATTMPEEVLLEGTRSSHDPQDPALSGLRVTLDLATELQRSITPELIKARLVAPQSEARLQEVLQRVLSPDLVARLAVAARGNQDGRREVLSGDISVITIAEVLQMLQMQRQTGSLEVSQRDQQITLYVVEGNVDFAGSHGLADEFLLGRYLVRDGAITRELLERSLSSDEHSAEMIGQRLIKQGVVTEQQLQRALMAQTSELVYEVVRWSRGRFAFRVGDLTREASSAKLGLPVSALVMEGFRRVDEWRLIEGSFDFDEVLYRDQVAIERIGNDSELTSQERAVLSAIDGERTVREIVDVVTGSSFELCKILYQLLNSRLVRRKAA